MKNYYFFGNFALQESPESEGLQTEHGRRSGGERRQPQIQYMLGNSPAGGGNESILQQSDSTSRGQ